MIRNFLTVNNTFSCATRIGIVFSLFVLLFSCNSNKEDLLGNWAKATDGLNEFEGVARAGASCAVIGDAVYVAAGFDSDNNRLNDIWVYDANSKNWIEKAKNSPTSPPARSKAVAFSANGKFFLGLGYDRNTKLKDFWMYDPATDKWTEIAEFPGSARYGSIAFSINDIGYVGAGFDDNTLKDFWAYDPSSDSWTQKASLEGSKRRDAVTFVINNKGYVVTGRNNGEVADFCVYDPTKDEWSSLSQITDATEEDFDDDYTSIMRSNGVGFAIDGKGYVATGGRGGGAGSYVWEYDPVSDIWVEKTPFEGSPRADGIAFVLRGVPYVALGAAGTSSYYDDVWYFEPNAEYYEYDH